MRPNRPLKMFNTLSADRWAVVSQSWDLILAVCKDDKAKAEAWFKAVNPSLGGMSASEMILRGKEKQLLEVVNKVVEENRA